MNGLISRLESMMEPDREIDRLIHELYTGECTHREQEHYAIEDGNDYESGFTCKACGVDCYGKQDKWPKYTASLSAVVILTERLLPGWGWEARRYMCGMVTGQVWSVEPIEGFLGTATSPPLALLRALLRALEYSPPQTGDKDE